MTMPAQPVQGQPGTDPTVTPDTPIVATPPQEDTTPYAQYLEELPEDVRPLIEPKFKEWDANVTKRFQELHSQYEPWKEVTTQYDPDDVQGALQVALALQNNPEAFLRSFADAFPDLVKEVMGATEPAPSGTPTGEQGQVDLDPDDPIAQKLAQLEKMVTELSGGFTQEQQERQQSQQQQQLDAILTDLHTKHGDFDDTYILSQMAYANATPEQAMKAWQENVVSKFGQPVTNTPDPNATAPVVMPTGGGLPTSDVDVTKLNGSATEALVAQILAQAAQQG